MLPDILLPDYVKKIRLSKIKEPCSICFLHKNLCLCNDLPQLDIKTNITLVVHYKELKRPTNTGSLAVQALTNSQIKIRGEPGKNSDISDILLPNYTPFLFYPSENAQEITPEFIAQIQKPIQLIVPDGNWRQASKVQTRHKELAHIPRVKISAPNLYSQFLRKETTPEGMATLQAIACALRVIEGEEIYNELIKLYDLKLKKTLIARGHSFSE